MDQEVDEHVIGLANQLQELIQEGILKDPDENAELTARVQELRRQIETLGVFISLSFTFDTSNLGVKASVTIFKPKIDLSPENQKIYDEWHAKTIGLKI